MFTGVRDWLAFFTKVLFVTLGAGFLATVFIFRDVQAIVNASRWIRHTDEVLISLEQVTLQIALAESSQRGFIITNDPKYLDRYKVVIGRIDPALIRIRDLVRDNPGEQERLDALRTAIEPRLAEMGDLIAVRKSQGFDAAQAQVRTDRGFTLMETCLELIQAIRGEEQRLLAQRRKWQDKTFNRLVSLTILLEMCGLLYMYVLLQRKREIGRQITAERTGTEIGRYREMGL